MTPEQQRIAIAEACGWVNCISPTQDEYHFLADLELGLAMGNPVGRNLALHNDGGHHPLPDYLNDLNAMREAEEVLTEKQQRDYCFRLLLELVDGSVTNDLNDHFIFIRATAAQRAEAFLRTLGLWEESK